MNRCTLAALGLAAAALAPAGCGASSPGTADAPQVHPGEMVSASGEPCPSELPIGDDPSGHGFGVERAAEELPNLLEVQEAWVCRYDSFDHDTTPSGGVVMGWRLTGEAVTVNSDDLPSLQAALGGLALPAEQACTSDLGPRWMVAYTHEGDLTGVVVDDYGCRSVRLTDDPHTTPPGADDQEGAVGGVLDGGTAVLDSLGLGGP